MKKIFTVLLVILLLTLPSIGLASIGWDNSTVPESTPPCTLAIKLYEYTPTMEYGGSYYRPLTAVTKGTLIRFVVEATIVPGIDLSKLNLEIKTANLQMDPSAPISFIEGKNSFMYTGYVDSYGEMQILANLKYQGKTIAELPRISEVADGFMVDNLRFLCDSNHRIVALFYKNQELVRRLDGTLNLSAEDKLDLDKTLAYLGFSLDGNYGYLTKEAFEQRYGGAWKITATASLNKPVSNIVTPVYDVEVPQTGEDSLPVLLTTFCFFLPLTYSCFKRNRTK